MLKIEAKTPMNQDAIVSALRLIVGGILDFDHKPYITKMSDGKVKVTGRGGGIPRSKRFVVYLPVNEITTVYLVDESDTEEAVIAERIGPALIVGQESSVVITPMRATESFGYLHHFD